MKKLKFFKKALDKVLDLLFGYDFFISYRHADGLDYAKNLEIKLKERGYDSFLDTKSYIPGSSLSLFGKYSIKKTKRLILVGSPGILENAPLNKDDDWVVHELKAFNKYAKSDFSGSIIPINIGSTLDSEAAQTYLSPYVPRDVVWINENINMLRNGPTVEVVNKIVAAFDTIRQATIRMRALLAILFILAGLSIASLLLWKEANIQAARAVNELENANHRLGQAYLQRSDVLYNESRITSSVLTSWAALGINDSPSKAYPKLLRINAKPLTHQNRKKQISRLSNPIWVSPYYKHSGGKPVYSPNGEMIATQSRNTIILWEVDTGAKHKAVDVFDSEEIDRKITNEDLYWRQDGILYSIGSVWKEGTIYLGIFDTVNQSVSHSVLGELAGGFIRDVEFSNNGKYVASISRVGEAKVWNIESKAIIAHAFKNGFDGGILKFSPDSKFLSIGTDGGNIRVLNVNNGKEVFSKTVMDSDVEDMHFSHSGELLAVAFQDKNAYTIDYKNNKTRNTLKHNTDVESVIFDDMQNSIITGTDDGTIWIWSLQSGEEIHKLKAHQDDIYQMAISSNERVLVSSDNEGNIAFWDLEKYKLISYVNAHSSYTKLYLNSAKNIVITDGDDTYRFWTLGGLELHPKTNAVISDINNVAFLNNRNTLAALSDDKSLHVWNIQNDTHIRLVGKHISKIDHLLKFNKGKSIITGSDDGIISVWDYLDINNSYHIDYAGKLESIALSDNGSHLIAWGSYDPLSIWDFQSKEWRTLKESVYVAAISSNGAFVAAGDEALYLWETQTDYQKQILFGDDDDDNDVDFKHLSFSTDNKYLAAVDEDSIISIWNTNTKKIESYFPNKRGGQILEIEHIKFTPDSNYVILVSEGGYVSIWDWRDKDLITSSMVHTGDIESFDILGAETPIFVTSSRDNTIKLTAYPTGENILTIEGHAAGVNDAVISPDLHFLASAGNDSTVRVWDISYALPKILNSDARISAIAVLSDGKVVTANSHADISIWGKQNTLEYTFQTPSENSFMSIAVSPDQTLIAAATVFKVYLFSYPQGTPVKILNVGSLVIPSVAFSPDGKWLAASGDNTGDKDEGNLFVWDLGSDDYKLTNLKASGNLIINVNYSEDSLLLISSGANGTTQYWELGSMQEMSSKRREAYKVLSAKDATVTKKIFGVYIGDFEAGNSSKLNGDNINTGSHTALSQDGTIIAVSIGNRKIKLWKYGELDHYAQLNIPYVSDSDEISEMVFSENGKQIVVLYDSGVVIRSKVPDSEWNPNLNILPFNFDGLYINYKLPSSSNLYNEVNLNSY